MRRCPNCGGSAIELNDEPGRADLAMCVTRVSEDVTTYCVSLLGPSDYDAEGKVACGMTWEISPRRKH